MQDATVVSSWKRFIDKAKELIIPRPMTPGVPEKDAPQLANWEGEGGKSPV